MNREDIQRKSTKKPGGITGKGFVKGDPRINRNGRPRSFDYIRQLAQEIGDEVDPNLKRKNAEIVLRKLMREDGAKFIEIAYGRAAQGTQDVNVTLRFAYDIPEIKQ